MTAGEGQRSEGDRGKQRDCPAPHGDCSLIIDLMSLLFLISLMATCHGKVPALEAWHSTVVLRDARLERSMTLKDAEEPKAWQETTDGTGRTMALRIPAEGVWRALVPCARRWVFIWE